MRRLRCWRQTQVFVAVLAVLFFSPARAPASDAPPSLERPPAFDTGPDSAHAGANPQTSSHQELAAQAAPLTPEAWGDLLMARRNYVAAIEVYRQLPPDSAVIWNKLGVAYHHLFALDEAKRDYQKALSLDPKYSEAMNNLGTVFHGERNYRQAERTYRRALRLSPKSAVIYCNLGTAYFAQGNWRKGDEAYQRAFSLNPKIFDPDSPQWVEEDGPPGERAKMHFALAKMFAKAGNQDMALQYLRKSINEGFHDKKKLMEDADLASLRQRPEFQELIGAQPR